MYQLCKLAQSGYEIKLNDIAGQGINKYKLYLTKVVKIDFSMLNTEWSEISKLNELRNIIVHLPSTEIEISENNSRLITTLKSVNHLSFEEKTGTIDFYIEKKEFLYNFCRIIHRFLESIYIEENQNNQIMY